jgi:hypothetical protein
LCDLALEAMEPEKLAEVMRVLREEKAREHEQSMRERAIALAEDNAKIGWRKLELQQARTALRLLPAIRQILMEAESTAEERLAPRGTSWVREAASCFWQILLERMNEVQLVKNKLSANCCNFHFGKGWAVTGRGALALAVHFSRAGCPGR